jgi:hypothetical protein
MPFIYPAPIEYGKELNKIYVKFIHPCIFANPNANIGDKAKIITKSVKNLLATSLMTGNTKCH